MPSERSSGSPGAQAGLDIVFESDDPEQNNDSPGTEPRKLPSTVTPAAPQSRVMSEVFFILAAKKAAARCLGTIV